MNLTVIVCTYNRCPILPKALESIAVSQLPDSVKWEVLVVDNNSSDQTRTVVGEFCSRYPDRFQYLFESQSGLSYARNAGVKAARGDVLVFTDDDVSVEPIWLQNLTLSLLDGDWAGAGGRIIPVWPRAHPRWLSTDDPDAMGPFVAFDAGPVAGPLSRSPYGANMAFRKEMFQRYGMFRCDLGRGPNDVMGQEDLEFAERLLRAGQRLRYEPTAIVYHPVPENRLKKRFMRRWWFWYGYSEVLHLGLPTDVTWRVRGVPLYFAHRLVRWTLQWMFSVSPPRRFACERSVSYILGTAVACYKWPRLQAAQDDARGELARKQSESASNAGKT
jgi:glucosyl-dolichyl phosphate glucuronosyltransferase